LIVAACELDPSVAVTVALWLLGIEAAAVVLNVAVVAPAVTVAVAGTVSSPLLLASVTVEPPVGAVCVSVTVQVEAVPWPKLDGLQVTADSVGMLTTPPPAAGDAIPEPAALTATGLIRPIEVVVALGEKVI